MKKIELSLILICSFLFTGQFVADAKTTSDAEWTPIYTLSDNNIQLRKIFFVNENIGFAVGSEGTILKTSDGGNNWSSQNSGVSVILNDVFFIDVNIGYAVGAKRENETVIKTTDGGKNWSLISQSTGYNYISVCFTDANNGYIAGERGRIVKTTDGGVNWTRSLGSLNNLVDITFVNSTTGFAVGEKNTILKTIDSGVTWESKKTGNSSLNEVFFLDENTGFVAGSGILLKTSDGGETWNSIYQALGEAYSSVCFTSNNIGYAYAYDNEGGDMSFLKTVNGGTTWIRKPLTMGIRSIVFPTVNSGFAVSGNIILKYSE